MTAREKGRRRALMAVAMCAAVGASAACGIRPTSGPVSAGPAAVRPSAPDTSLMSGGTETHEIYLVHDGVVQSVARAGDADLRPDTPLTTGAFTAQADRLLRELAVGPTVDEAGVGWTTQVPAGAVHVVAPLGSDAVGTVRLDVPPDSLDRVALGQIVCTMQVASHTRSIAIAGRKAPAQEFSCDDFLNTPQATVPTAAATLTPAPAAS